MNHRSSNTHGTNCVAVACLTEAICIRGNKNPDAGNLIAFPGEFGVLVHRVKLGEPRG
ncbi:DUF397 domain-containing protein [Actinomadura craniellae]|uniref:DUF397 domain-containing protein n=1 Tax=Actinomadura craniellae TaxID=2231787 RepID=A0A365GZP0_9ACTN|nr:DUF397 domain-containing protein [Actinomadura craniellae]RAY11413.1 DUF397 domain-containing protein [Actinomadura craniellae]